MVSREGEVNGRSAHPLDYWQAEAPPLMQTVASPIWFTTAPLNTEAAVMMPAATKESSSSQADMQRALAQCNILTGGQ